MATWVDPIDSETDPDAPLTSDLAKQWSYNLVAFYEQDDTSPVSPASWHPYNRVLVGGTEDGLLWDHSVDGNISTIQTPNLDSGWMYSFDLYNFDAATGPSVDLQVEIKFYDNSDTLIRSEFVFDGTVSSSFSFRAVRQSVLFGADDPVVVEYGRSSGILSGPDVTPEYVKFARLVTNGDFTGGQVKLRRKSNYI